jgi:hypothetical protein
MYDWLQGLVMLAGVNISTIPTSAGILWQDSHISLKKSPAVAQHAKLFHLRIQMRILIINLSTISTSSMSRDFGHGPIF